MFELEIENLIKEKVAEIGRPDLFRDPLVKYVEADNPGFSELKNIIGPWHNLPSDFLEDAVSVISYFVPSTKEVVEGPSKALYCDMVWNEAYDIINANFPVISQAVIDYLKSKGYEAVQTITTYHSDTLRNAWSHRSAAVVAGLASFGANRIGMTEKGSAGRYCTIITNAPLTPSGEYKGPRCEYLMDGSCGLCIAKCPAQALDKDWEEGKFMCNQMLNHYSDVYGKPEFGIDTETCGKCISICPHAYIE